MLMAVFLGAISIPTETERRTILTILAKPVSRGQFLWGKYLGILLTVWANVALMSVIFLALVAYKKPIYVMNATIWKALLLVLFELAVVAAIAITLATFSTMSFTLICSFFIYFLGQVADGLRYYSDPQRGGAVGAIVAGMLYPILPHFENFDIREAIMNTEALAPWKDVLLTCGSGALYVAIVLMLGYSVFKDREF
jgi:ABC-type Na+ efflux pump permease subunit